jgi:hypothetical protein
MILPTRIKRIFVVVVCLAFGVMRLTAQQRQPSHRPSVALRTNLLYDFAVLTPNLGVEMGFSPRQTLLFTGSYNPWKSDSKKDNKKLNHWLLGLEYRRWLCERFNGHFLGAHAFFSRYNIAGVKIPLILEKHAGRYRYNGDAYGVGVSYGYHWMWTKYLGLEFNIGVGVGFMEYDCYDRSACSACRAADEKRTFVAPTKAGISLVYVIQ